MSAKARRQLAQTLRSLLTHPDPRRAADLRRAGLARVCERCAPGQRLWPDPPPPLPEEIERRLRRCLDSVAWSAHEPAADGCDPALLGELYLALRDGRRAAGVYYTPPPAATFMAREALAAWLEPACKLEPAVAAAVVRGAATDLTDEQAGRAQAALGALRVIDPACGCGDLLVACAAVLATMARGLQHRSGVVAAPTWPARLLGRDRDGEAGAIARVRLALARPGASDRVEVADALRLAAVPEFDIVLLNPPYLDMVAMESGDAPGRAELRRRFATARGGFDLFVPFVEQAIALLREEGVLAALTPDKLLSADYAAALRAHYLRELDLWAIADFSRARLFPAHVYPAITVGRRRRAAAPRPPVRVWHAEAGELRPAPPAPPELAELVGNRWAVWLEPDAERLLRGAARLPRLGDLAEVRGAATVAEAYAWAAALIDQGEDLRRADPARYARFVTSGALRPHGQGWEDRPVRYLGVTYRRPVLDLQHPALTPRRAAQARPGKVILSGLARRPLGLWDSEGLAAAKSTVLIYPGPGVSGAWLAAVLNADIVATLHRLFFGALSLAGGYLRFGPPQLRALPVPPPEARDQAEVERLLRRRATSEQERADCDQRLEAIVARRYGCEPRLDDASRACTPPG